MTEPRQSFDDVRRRLDEIVDEVRAEDVSLDDALKLYEEAVKLGLQACDMSEEDAEQLMAEQAGEREAACSAGVAPDSPAAVEAADASANPAARPDLAKEDGASESKEGVQ